MARQKTDRKAKEPVTIRFKELKGGNKSIYLDIYNKGVREYKFLKLYIVPEPKGKGAEAIAAKIANENAMQIATAIKAQIIIDIAQGKAGFSNKKSQADTILFTDWLAYFQKKAEDNGSIKRAQLIATAIKRVKEYNDKSTLAQINKQWLVGFVEYLNNATNIRKGNGEKIKQNSRSTYFSVIATALSYAEKQGYISFNPTYKLDYKPHGEQGKRDYLTTQEVKDLMNTKCRFDNVKQAFLFSCFCGLRISDICALTWGDIYRDGDQTRVAIKMQKTKRDIIVPLSSNAIQHLPNRGTAKDTDNVFSLPMNLQLNRVLKQWAKAAGITKNISFHVSRHTFATLSLTAGVDIYTTSKLLGHSDVKVTQIYAKIIDSKKDDAVNKISNLFD